MNKPKFSNFDSGGENSLHSDHEEMPQALDVRRNTSEGYILSPTERSGCGKSSAIGRRAIASTETSEKNAFHGNGASEVGIVPNASSIPQWNLFHKRNITQWLESASHFCMQIKGAPELSGPIRRSNPSVQSHGLSVSAYRLIARLFGSL